LFYSTGGEAAVIGGFWGEDFDVALTVVMLYELICGHQHFGGIYCSIFGVKTTINLYTIAHNPEY
jgi:hypothetical protein